SLAVDAAATLRDKGRSVRVVSAPCLELLLEQGDAYFESLFPTGTPIIACEAALRFGWDEIIGRKGGFVGMTGFGASAPAEVLYEHFGITAEAIVAQADALLG
ncbi:transketolase C-terminal domain-containing protein, partial [uncultured Maricaulis sp.]|uniref:transketolase-like TK C-terminal-containing protein n=1 Tax=uncultured Maricaulis sp. TaxID=174710 RepID=UPI0030D88242